MFQALADHVPDGVLVVDVLRRRIVFANRHFAAALDYLVDELVGRPIADLDPIPIAGPPLRAVLHRLAAEAAVGPEVPLRRRDGSVFTADLGVRPVLCDGRRYLMAMAEDNSARRRLEAMLHRQDMLLRDAGEIARLGGWELDPASGAGAWTEEAARIFDGQGGRVSLQTGLSFFSPEARGQLEPALATAIEQGTPFDLELPITTRAGRAKWVRVIGHPISEEGVVRRLRGAVQDITEQRLEAEARRRSEALFATIFQRSPVGIVITRVADGRILDVNDAYASVLGYDRQELIGRTTLELQLWADPEDRERMTQLAEHGGVQGLETRLRCRSGAIRTMLIAVETIELDGDTVLLGMASDISPMKEIEARLRVSEERLRAIIDSAESLIWVKDLEGRFLVVNRATEQATRRPAPALIGHSLFELFPPEDVERYAAHDRQVIESGQPLEIEETAPLADGPHTFLTVRTPLRDGAGRIYAVAAISTDISDRKRSEDAVHEANLQLEQRVRDRTAELEAANRELEAFAYSVSHDLRAPLRAMDGFSLALLEDNAAQLDDAGRAHLGRVRAAAQRMSDLIDNLLLLSRVARAELRRDDVDLTAVAHAVAAELRAAHPDRAVELRIAAGLRVRGDERLLRLVIENLLGNAWKFTAGCRLATIEVGSAAVAPPDAPRAGTAYFVRDNGAGFDMAHADKLFEPFQRLHTITEFPGTGIGLASVHRIIRRHGGHVWARGAVGRGATVYFTL